MNKQTLTTINAIKRILSLILVAGALLIQGCSVIEPSIAYYRSTQHFVPHPKDSRVVFEKGAEALSGIVVKHLDSSIQQIERSHYEGFSKKVKIHVCATDRCMKRHTASSKASGSMIGDKIFLSPTLLSQPNSIKSVLTHELSHLHFSQKLGKLNLSKNIPGWFQEGFATYVSKGAGAEKVSRSEVLLALKLQTFFVPEDHGAIVFVKKARSHGFHKRYKDPAIASHMFYKQSELFVEHLHDKNTDRFKGLVSDLLRGYQFKRAFEKNYNLPLIVAWVSFVRNSRFKL